MTALPALAVAEPTVTDEELFEDAIAAEAEASPARWRAADCYAALSRRGYSTRAIGARVGKSQSHIVFALKCARDYPGNQKRPEFQEAYEQAKGSVHFSSESPEWETPQELFELLDAEFGFTLDVCATAGNAKCARFFTSEDDGLAQEWTGVCWMNPPYGREIAAWIAKAHESGDAGATVVCLVPARTDTDWFWDHARHAEVRLLHGRLRFGEASSGAPFPSAVVVFGRKPSVIWWDRV
jgi:phage N-6-adenine-methyltransferase